MNKNILRDYAPKARMAFIEVVTDKAALYGITGKSILPCEVRGDFAFINGRPFPKVVDTQRKELLRNINQHSFSHVMEEIAYTWFNRFAAIRFMEVNGYLSHGYRVLSHPEGHSIPEIVEKAQFIGEMSGLDREEVILLKMAGDKDDELYRKLLIAQCNELSSAMPFLFEKVDDPTELLLPDNLLHTGSIIREMVETIPEEDWREVEIIGWLYQFYISEKKDGLIKAKKAYKSEDIPAVTQLFTPNWIVKYLIQNTLGAKWLRTYPTSSLKSKMEYYIEPAEQTPEVIEELKRITPSSLNPEELTVMDPACGSGHILVEAYDLLKEIYLERGYRRRDIPRLILEKNLFGLEIDDRAAQLAGFALMMEARRDDSGIFEREVKPNVLVIKAVTGEGAKLGLEVFENANTFGSLIRIPDSMKGNLPVIKKGIDELEKRGDLLSHNMIEDLTHIVRQAELLSRRYDVVVANPPYMGSRYMNLELKSFAKGEYSDTKSDLFAMFAERILEFTVEDGWSGLMTPFNWMYLQSYEKLRSFIIQRKTILSLVKPSYTSFFESAIVPICAYILQNSKIRIKGHYFDLGYLGSAESQPIRYIEALKNPSIEYRYSRYDTDFKKIPGSPIAYWVSDRVRDIFGKNRPMGDLCSIKHGLATGKNDLLVRYWHEISVREIDFSLGDVSDVDRSYAKYFPYNKGGTYRKWFGNNDFVLRYDTIGRRLMQSLPGHRHDGKAEYFHEGITWTWISSSYFGARYSPRGFVFDVAGSSLFPMSDLEKLLGFMCSFVADYLLRILNPTINFSNGVIARLPVIKQMPSRCEYVAESAVFLSKQDWDSYETSWDFAELPLLSGKDTEAQSNIEEEDGKTLTLCAFDPSSLRTSYSNCRILCQRMTGKVRELEEENNHMLIEAYGLQDELTPDVPIEEITLFANPKYRYKGDLSDDELEARFKEDTMKELISYSVGCMMGRYSLDEPGLIPFP